MDGEEELNVDYDDSSVEKIVKDENHDDSLSTQDSNTTVVEKSQSEEHQKDTTPEEIETESIVDESISSIVPEFNLRRESGLKEMDKRHAWLSELEKKCRYLETAYISKIQYVAISNHCQRYLEELSSDGSMTQFRIEFSNLFKKFRTAFTGSQQLLNKIQEMKAHRNIANEENKKLKVKLEKQLRIMEELQVNRELVEGELLEMEKEKKNLQRLFTEFQESMESENQKREQEAEGKPILQVDEEAHEKIIELEQNLELITNDLEFTKQRESMYQNKAKQAENVNTSLHQELNSIKVELEKQRTRAEKAESIVLEKAGDLESKTATIKTMTDEAKQMTAVIERTKNEANRLYKDLKSCQKDLGNTTQMVEKLRRDATFRDDRIKMLGGQKDSIEADLVKKRVEANALKDDIMKITKEKNSSLRRVTMLEERSTDAETQASILRKEKAAMQRELDVLNKELDETDIKMSELSKQKESLSEAVFEQGKTIIKLEGEITLLQDKCYKTEKAYAELKRFVGGLEENIRRLEKIKENSAKEIADLNKNIVDLRSDMAGLEIIISDSKKMEGKLRQQLDDEQTKYKNMADDERHCRRLLGESRHECTQLRDQLFLQRQHVEQLQSYHQLLEEKSKKLTVNVITLKEQMVNIKEAHRQEVRKNEELNAQLKRLEDQGKNLLKNLGDMESEEVSLKRKAKTLSEEKCFLNSKLAGKEGEIRELRENNRRLQLEVTSLDRTVNEKNNNISLLEVKISEMARINALMREKVQHMDSAQQELTSAENKVMEQQFITKTLEEDIQKKANLHRWRILEGSDPERAELLSRNQALQKQLNKRMSELNSKEVELREKEKLAQSLQDQLSKCLEPNIQEQLWTCKKELGSRTERVKCLTAENDMYENLCKKYEREIMNLKGQVRQFKMKEFNLRASKKRKVS